MRKTILLIILGVALIIYILTIFFTTKPLFEFTIRGELPVNITHHMISLWIIFFLIIISVVFLAFILISYEIITKGEIP